MNKPIQVLEASAHFSATGQGVANSGRREDGDSSFSSILSQNNGEQIGADDGQSLPDSGNTLPARQARSDDQQDAAEGTPAAADQTDASGEAVVIDELVTAAGVNQPEQPAVQSLRQVAPVTDVAAIEGTGFVSATGVEGQPLSSAEPLPAAVAAQQVQAQDHVEGTLQPAMMQTVSLTVPGLQVQQAAVRNAGVPGVAADSSAMTAENGRPLADTGPLAGAVREALQLAAANQPANSDSKQFMQQHSNQQAASSLLPAASSGETAAVPFLQTLSDSAVTMPSARVAVAVGQSGWGEAVGQQLTWFVSQKISSASVRLNPQHLGPMEMAVTMDGDKASITFTSQHSIVRDALESSIPRLREMLSENGLNLVNVNVSQQGRSHRDGQGESGFGQGSGVAKDDAGASEAASGAELRRMTVPMRGLVDDYA
ncbi:MAG: flagellar hook-length control protein FliK [Gammaproteobacteria bacterium]|jgi:flagellar hook-length control protein FliK